MDGADQGTSPPPGWHPDPNGQPGWRWWDGIRWTDHTAPLTPPYPVWQGGPDPTTVYSLQLRQARFDRVIAVGVVFWAVAGIVGVLIATSNVDYYRAVWHWFHLAFDAARLHQAAPPQPAKPLANSLFSLAAIAILVLEVLYLLWQYRAAAVARALGYPMRQSPGWGVGCWFVPVVNLWMPYQAVRDCLPVGHPARRQVLQAWIGFLAIHLLLGPATIVVLLNARGPAVGGLFVVAVVAYGFVAWTARRFVLAIAADHRDAVVALTGRPSAG